MTALAGGERQLSRPVRRRTLRTRLTAWYAVAFSAGLAMVAGASLITLERELADRADRYLRAAWRAFATELLVEAKEYADSERAIAETIRELRFEDTSFEVTPLSPPRAERSDAATRPDDTPDAPAAIPLTLTTDVVSPVVGGGAAAVLARQAVGRLAFHGRNWSVTALHPLTATQETLRSVRLAYALILPVVLALGLIGGYATAGRALAPVAEMGRRARSIEASTLHDRLPVENPEDELGELGSVINDLLARLESAFAQQRRLVADASHELRTPVAVIMAEADVLLAREGRAEAEYRERIGVLRDATARLTRLVDDLFLLSRADSGHVVPRREPLYLAELMSDAVRTMQGIAAQRGVLLRLEVEEDASDELEGAPAEGDPALLDRLLLNLLDNAIKHSPHGSTVRITLRHEEPQANSAGRTAASHYVIRVVDTGSGIPAAAQPFIFDRFYRADGSRSRSGTPRGSSDGAGLGLAIARWVAETHGGALVLERSDRTGTTFRWEMPASAQGLVGPLDRGMSGS